MPLKSVTRQTLQRHGSLMLMLTLGIVALLLFAGLSSFGIWDPVELDRAERARELLESGLSSRGSLAEQLTAAAFSVFGTRGWVGRLPFALAGLITACIAVLMARLVAPKDKTLLSMAALVTGTNAMFLFHSRHMIGHGIGMCLQTLLAFSGAWLLLSPEPPPEPRPLRRRKQAQWFFGLLVFALSLGLVVWAEGALLGALPPLVAVSLAKLFQQELSMHGSAPAAENKPQRKTPPVVAVLALAKRLPYWTASRSIVYLTTLGMLAGVGLAVIADADAFSFWLGGRPTGVEPPTFEDGLELIFHGFAPWSALLPVALLRLMAPKKDPREGLVSLSLLFWLILGYGTYTLFGARYGSGAFLPVVALALPVALLLREVNVSTQPWRAAAVVSALFGALLIRDFALYPDSPLRGLGTLALTFPEADAFNPREAWAGVLGVFVAVACLGLWVSRPDSELDLARPYHFLRAQLQRKLPHKLWAWLALVFWGLTLLVGLGSWLVAPGSNLLGVWIPTLAVKALRAVGLAAALLPGVVAVVQAVPFFWGKLGRFRMLPSLFFGVVAAGYLVWGFVPALSNHLSPRAVFDRYKALAGPKETLGEFRVGSRVASYYTGSEPEALGSAPAVAAFLQSEERRWLVYPASDLPTLNKVVRRTLGHHLFVVDDTSAKLHLAVNLPPDGLENQSVIASAVLNEAPTPMHPSDGQFEQSVSLLGYDLELPRDGFVGAGDKFAITWYWRAQRASLGSFKVFLHIDGQGHRLNGDHDPVDGHYPVHLWQAGDVVVDKQVLTLPGNYRPGRYTLYVGFYQGSRRLKVTEGKQDGADRLAAGTFEVR